MITPLTPKNRPMASPSETLRPRNYPRIYNSMTTEQDVESDLSILDWEAPSKQNNRVCGSLSYFLARLKNQGIKPDAFLFTVFSAIPVVDAIKAYYEELGQPPPELVPALGKRPVYRYSKILKQQIANRESFLGSSVAGATVAIIDQYVDKGETVNVAAASAYEAGAVACYAVTKHTQWYERTSYRPDKRSNRHNALLRDSIDRMSSPIMSDRVLMRRIGLATARVVETEYDFLLSADGGNHQAEKFLITPEQAFGLNR
jgi:hypothetical protein